MSVEDIYLKMAENAGNIIRQKGAIYGNMVAGVSQIPGQIMDDRERQQIIDAQQARLKAQDVRGAAQDARQASADQRDQAATQLALQHQQVVNAGLTAAIGDSGDPSQFDPKAAYAAVSKLGHPEAIQDVIAAHIRMRPQLTSGAPGSAMRDEAGQVVPGSQVPDKPPVASPAQFAADANDMTKSPLQRATAQQALTALQQTPSADETNRHNQAMEAIGKMTAGREVAAQQETARHNRASEATAANAADPFGLRPAAGQVPSAAGGGPAAPTGTAGQPPVTGQPPAAGGAPASLMGATGPTGDDFLKTLQPGIASEVKAYAQGLRPFPTGMSYAKLQPLIQLVGQYDPSFDPTNYNARNRARTDLTSTNGTGAKTIGALNTAIQHAGKLSDLIETLDNSNYPLVNAVVNPLKSAGGSTAVTNYNTVAPQLAKEIERVWRGAGGTAGEIHDLVETIGQNKGKQQQREALQQFVELAKGKLDALQTQRDNVMGKSAGATIPILFPQNQPIVDSIAQRATGKPAMASAAPTEGQEGTVGGVPAVWKTVNGKAGWYAK